MRKTQTWYKKANPNPDVAKHVGGNAKKGAHNRKAQKRLDQRIADFVAGTKSNESKVKSRWSNGGFHKPGSMQK